MVRSRCLEIETVLRKFNPWEQNLEISSRSLTSHGKLGLLTQLRGEGQRTEADERTRTAFLLITSDPSDVAGICTALQIRISRLVPFHWFALCCTVLRSRWCQSGVKIALVSTFD